MMMRVGIACAGIGAKSTPDYLEVTAKVAEECGFATLWMGEHVALFAQYPLSRSPSKSAENKAGFEGDSPIPDPTMPILDPLVALAWIAAHTETIELGTSVIILPQRNPLVLAKSVATADLLSGGRLVLGMGWSVEEYQACGVPWSGRGRRMDEYLAAMRNLWRDDVSSFHGETVSFENVYSFPKPVRLSVPLIMGGESEPMLRRVARYGDGWIAFNMTTADAPVAISRLRGWTQDAGRDPSAMRLIVAIFDTTTVDDMCRYRDAGFTEFYYVAGDEIPSDAKTAPAALRRAADRFINAAAKL
jgi:probable F420-dependent oxidoreductase